MSGRNLENVTAPLKERLTQQFGARDDDIHVVRSPYRICPLGAHVDHQLGEVSGMALDRGLFFAFAPSSQRRLRLRSVDLAGEVEFSLDNIRSMRPGHWGNYARGAVLALQQDHELRHGLDGIIHGQLPSGGVGSSAAVGVAYLLALAKANDIDLDPHETIALDSYIENTYLGLANGILDQSMVLLGRRGELLSLDCQTRASRHIPLPGADPPLTIVLIYSGIERELVDTDYNRHVAECCEAAAAMLRASGAAGVSLPESPVLRDVPHAVFEEYGAKLPEHLRRRARHFFSETARVAAGARAWERGDLAEFGRLVTESGKSSIDDYGCGSPEMIALYNILRETEGVYGARPSGAGFRGCCIALVDPDRAEAVAHRASEEYLRQYPTMKDGHGVFFCRSADGAEVL